MYYKEKANLAEFAYKLYEQLLKKVFMDPSIKLSYDKKILLYCFLHKGISFHQICMVFAISINLQNSLKTVLHRMIKNKTIKKITYGLGNEIGYCITQKGIKSCNIIAKNLIEKHLNNLSLTYDDYVFTINDILDYLSNRCSSSQPKYWQHHFSSRDIYVYLISCKCNNRNFNYETEVAIDAGGRPVSIYTRSLLALNLNYDLRSDGMLTYISSKGTQLFRFFIEADNGSQSTRVIKDKVKKYIENIVDTEQFTPTTSLMFCINTSCDALAKDAPIKSSTADYYYGLLLVAAYDMLQTFGVQFRSNNIEEVISYIESRNRDNQSKGIYQITNYFRNKTSIFKENMLITELLDLYKESVVVRQVNKKLENNKRHKKKYLARRSLIQQSINDIPGIYDAFLRGFSIYTVFNYDLDITLPYINFEITSNKIKLLKILSRYKIFSEEDGFEYKTYISLNKEVFFKNYYYSEKIDKGIIIENISDDLGGCYRIKRLLELDKIPSFILRNITLICICDGSLLYSFRDKYLDTKHGKILSRACTDYIKDVFEVLFITYEGILYEDKLFTFSVSGEIIYKEKPLTRNEKGSDLPF